jgi:hypothetical protein
VLAVAPQLGRLAFLFAVFAAVLAVLSAFRHGAIAGRVRALDRIRHSEPPSDTLRLPYIAGQIFVDIDPRGDG